MSGVYYVVRIIFTHPMHHGYWFGEIDMLSGSQHENLVLILWISIHEIIGSTPKDNSIIIETHFIGYCCCSRVDHPYTLTTGPICPIVMPFGRHCIINLNTITNITHKGVGDILQARTDMQPSCYSFIWHQRFYHWVPGLGAIPYALAAGVDSPITGMLMTV